jgi:hypothetical protein
MDFFDRWFPGLFIGALALCLVGMIGAMVAESRRPGFELKKADWVCTQSHSETSTTLVSSGNGQVTPIISTYTVCDQWTHR